METEKKYARILTSYYRPKPGGLCKRLFRAINALLAAGHEVHYLAVVPFPIEHPRCHFHRFPWPSTRADGYWFWGYFYLLAPIMLLAIGFKTRITHSFAFHPAYAFFMQPLRLCKGVPIALFFRADIIENHRINGRGWWLLTIEKLLEAAAISGVSMYGVSETLTKEILSRHRFLGPKSFGVLYNDVESTDTMNRAQQLVSLPLRLSCVGIVEKRKNQDFIIRCMKFLPAEKVHLYLYGVGPDQQELEVVVSELQVDDRVTMMGWVDRAEIWKSTDLLLFPSLHEGAPNAVLEALANEIPVLASDIPEHREILPQESLLPLNNLQSWVQEINYLLADPEKRLQRLAERQKVCKEKLKFDWDGLIRKRILGATD